MRVFLLPNAPRSPVAAQPTQPDGEWYCFEINPSPGFIYYERHSGLPISAALADLLHGTASA